MAFKEISEEELVFLDEEEREQYEKQLSLYKKRVAFVSYMERMGEVKIKKLKQRTFPQIPVAVTPEVSEFCSPEQSKVEMSPVNVPDMEVGAFENPENRAVQVPTIEKRLIPTDLHTFSYDRRELPEYPVIPKRKNKTAVFSAPESVNIQNTPITVPAERIPGQIDATVKAPDIEHIRASAVIVPGFTEMKAKDAKIQVKTIPAFKKASPIEVNPSAEVSPCNIRVPKKTVFRNTGKNNVKVPPVAVPDCEVTAFHGVAAAVPEVGVSRISEPVISYKRIEPQWAVLPKTPISLKGIPDQKRKKFKQPDSVNVQTGKVKMPSGTVPTFHPVLSSKPEVGTVHIPGGKNSSYRKPEELKPEVQRIQVPSLDIPSFSDPVCREPDVQSEKVKVPKNSVPVYHMVLSPESEVIRGKVPAVSVPVCPEVDVPAIHAKKVSMNVPNFADFKIDEKVETPEESMIKKKKELIQKAEALKTISFPDFDVAEWKRPSDFGVILPDTTSVLETADQQSKQLMEIRGDKRTDEE